MDQATDFRESFYNAPCGYIVLNDGQAMCYLYAVPISARKSYVLQGSIGGPLERSGGEREKPSHIVDARPRFFSRISCLNLGTR